MILKDQWLCIILLQSSDVIYTVHRLLTTSLDITGQLAEQKSDILCVLGHTNVYRSMREPISVIVWLMAVMVMSW